MKLSKTFYLRSDVVALAKELLGKILYTQDAEGCITAGIILETESYAGATDRASHAYNNRRTPRTEILFRAGGIAYVYLCYGMHYLTNVVTHQEGIPHAILLRAIHPIIGISAMQRRRGSQAIKNLCAGPGTLSAALGITKEHNGLSLTGNRIWIEESDISFPRSKICSGPRIGIDYAGADAKQPWRFWLASPPHARVL
jgi:DNA-3-methyladenine glycosylase